MLKVKTPSQECLSLMESLKLGRLANFQKVMASVHSGMRI